MVNLNRLELLAPAGDMERFNAALIYGANAIYLGGKTFGMRAGPQNFTTDELVKAVQMAHDKGVKVYLTCNTLPRNNEIPYFQEFIENAVVCKVDAVIVTDLGIFSLVKKFAPDMEIHVSTQAGIVNYASANEFYNMGAKRVVLARELSLNEIAEIRAKTPDDLDLEAFVHGAMCMSFSGRCLLSNYLTGRDANRGECAQPCRWNYHLMEETRPGEYFPIFEDNNGTYILNSKDMCMIDYIDKVAEAGVTSFKIEGRAKSAYYVSVVTNAYRMAIDLYKKNPGNFKLPEFLKQEVFKISHRNYCTGFFFENSKECRQYYGTSGYIREYDVIAVINECKDGKIHATQRNKFNVGDEVEVLSPGKQCISLKINELYDEYNNSIESANHAMMNIIIPSKIEFPKNSIIRTIK